MGAGFKTKDMQYSDPLNGQTSTVMRLSIWDTVGQEKFDSLTKLYFNNTEAALIVYDVTDEESFVRVKKWMKELAEHETNSKQKIIKYVVGNKIDCTESIVVSATKAESYAL